VPIYASTSFTFDNSDHGAALFALQAAGQIYTRIGTRPPPVQGYAGPH